jgi:cytochrome P450/NADPH-cytochrome P450 reductase
VMDLLLWSWRHLKVKLQFLHYCEPRAEATTGQPTDNAGHFVNWLESLEGNELAGVRFGVFGCGNREWVQTYQRIPELCDKLLEQRGGNRLLHRGVGDASEENFFQVFEEFESNLWKVLCKVCRMENLGLSDADRKFCSGIQEYQTSRSESSVSVLEMETVDPGRERATTLRQPDAALGRVIENRLLTKPGAPIKHHIGER